jgi:hypothetical protein
VGAPARLGRLVGASFDEDFDVLVGVVVAATEMVSWFAAAMVSPIAAKGTWHERGRWRKA